MKPDFQRRIHCVLGLNFDLLNETEAVEKLQHAVSTRTPCFFSTPNLSFATATQKNAKLRDSVNRSDMSVPDGMPLIWASLLMGVPTAGRVAGSSVFEQLRHRQTTTASPPIKVYFFGGNDGVASLASDKLNAESGGIRCVGYESPGFGDIASMSTPERLQRINASAADFVVVSIGVAKGQEWIERNRQLISAPVISYLGAVINFVAGKVERAPRWIQRLGMEWLWRIKEEPALWRRYAGDGWSYLGLVVGRILPYRWHTTFNQPSIAAQEAATIEREQHGNLTVLRLNGPRTANNIHALRPALEQLAELDTPIHIDLDDCNYADSATIGLLSLLWAYRRSVATPIRISTRSSGLRKMLRYCCADYILTPLSAADPHRANA